MKQNQILETLRKHRVAVLRRETNHGYNAKALKIMSDAREAAKHGKKHGSR